jgi:hypothetical protein
MIVVSAISEKIISYKLQLFVSMQKIIFYLHTIIGDRMLRKISPKVNYWEVAAKLRNDKFHNAQFRRYMLSWC